MAKINVPEIISFSNMVDECEDTGCYWRHKEVADEEDKEVFLSPSTPPRPLRF